MSAPLHASRTPDQHQELLALRRDPDLRPRAHPRIVVLDNADIHHAQTGRQGPPGAGGRARHLAVVPAGPDPELNDIERTFTETKTLTVVSTAAVRQVNAQLMPAK